VGRDEWGGGPCTAVTPTCTVYMCDKGALTTTERKLTSTAPSEQTHPQNSRFTPRCPSVVL
jgi:hypothetical protein